MPSYKFECKKCGKPVQRILLAGDQKKPQIHKDCGGDLVRVGAGPSVLVKETLDNGAMPHAVERLKDAEQLYKDRARNDPRYKS